MKQTGFKKVFLDYLGITVGVFILAFAISCFFEPHHLVTGGVTGIGIILQGLGQRLNFPIIPLWLSNAAINVPLLILGLKVNGLSFTKKTLFASLLLSVALYITQMIPLIKIDMLLAAAFGGVISGIGLGIVFRFNGTTGGSDLAASIIKKYNRHISLGTLMLVIDGIIILVGLLTFDAETALYGIIALFLSTKAIDAILEGLSFSKAAYIISDTYEKIASEVDKQMARGCTYLHGTGAYTKNEKKVLLCVVSAKEIVKLKDIVKEADEAAFMFVADVREVLGEGFTPFASHK